MTKINKIYYNLRNTHIYNLFMLQLIFFLIFVLFILPIINFGLGLTIRLWGQSYVTSKNLLSYLTSPYTLIFLLFIILLVSLLILYQLITMIYFTSLDGIRNNISLLHLLFKGFKRTMKCLFSGSFGLPVFSVLLFIFINLPVLLIMTLQVKLNYPNHANQYFLKILLLPLYAIITFIALKGVFVVHIYILEQKGFIACLEKSKALLRKKNLLTFKKIIINNIRQTALFFVYYYFTLIAAAFFIYLCVGKTMVMSVFLSVYPRINNTLLLIFYMVIYLTNIKLISKMYKEYNLDTLTTTPESTHELYRATISPSKKSNLISNLLILCVLLAALLNAYITLRNDAFYLQNALSGIRISSHRGNSHVAPENTLPALENAIIAGSDYAEIDVRQTKDGILVLMHDNNLKRTAGINKDIGSLTYKELSQLDVGSWFSTDFIYTKIPTLEEAIKLCKGRIKLNIEIKTSNKGIMFEENLVSIIEKNNFEHSCLISSMDYNSIDKIKKLNPLIKTGLITKYIYGNFHNFESVDFISMRSSNITRQVVDNAHKNGKEIHAWTVNSVSEIERMKSAGVDCIITDNPTLTKRVLYQENSGSTFIQLLNHILSP